MANYVLTESLKFDNVILMAENQLYRAEENTRKAIKWQNENAQYYSEAAYAYLLDEADENNTNNPDAANEKEKKSIGETLKAILTAIGIFFAKLGKVIWNFIQTLLQWATRQIAKIKAKKINGNFKGVTAYSIASMNAALKVAADACNTTEKEARTVTSFSGEFGTVGDTWENASIASAITNELKEETITDAVSYLSGATGVLKQLNGLNSKAFKALKTIQAATKKAIAEANKNNTEELKKKTKELSKATKLAKKTIMEANYALAKKIRGSINSVVKAILGKDAELAPGAERELGTYSGNVGTNAGADFISESN